MGRSSTIKELMLAVTRACETPYAKIKIANLHGQWDQTTWKQVKGIRDEIARRVNPGFYTEESIRMRLNMTFWSDTHVGCCDECAATAVGFCLKAARERKVATSIELVGTGTHAFVVVARNQENDINTLAAWGDDAFIVDIWDSFEHPGEPRVKPEPQKWKYLAGKCTAKKVICCRLWLTGEEPIKTRGWDGKVSASIL